jgi:hypothetical protein
VLEVQSSQEKRVSSLEARLSELSESVGGYEKDPAAGPEEPDPPPTRKARCTSAFPGYCTV